MLTWKKMESMWVSGNSTIIFILYFNLLNRCAAINIDKVLAVFTFIFFFLIFCPTTSSYKLKVGLVVVSFRSVECKLEDRVVLTRKKMERACGCQVTQP